MSYLIDTCILSEFVKRKPSQPERALKLHDWLNTLELSFSQRILPINDDVLDKWPEFSASMENQGNTLAIMDSLIGATAFCYDLTLATRNVDDFKLLPIKIMNPFEIIS